MSGVGRALLDHAVAVHLRPNASRDAGLPRLSDTFSLPQVALGYGALALVATLFAVIGARSYVEDDEKQPA